MDSGNLDIILALVVVGFLFWRLHAVLGTSNEEDHPGDNAQAPDPYTVQQRHAHDAGPQDVPPPAYPSADDIHATSVNAGLAQISAADPGFDEPRFLAGVKQAFAMIVTAYAKGDRESLRMLLSDGLYVTFDRAITDREAASETQETEIDRITTLDIREAELKANMARITVDITSEQMNVTRDKAGHTVAGHPDRLDEVHDIWTFERDVTKRDPTWTLVETRAPAA